MLLFLSLPFFAQAQFPVDGFYLSDKNEISEVKTGIKCTKNEDLSREYIECYDCRNSNGELVKQVNRGLYLSGEIRETDAPDYIKNAGEFFYLFGDLKDGKPFNGFFKDAETEPQWLLYNHYVNGQLTDQFYRDSFKAMLAEEDNRRAFQTLDRKNIFENGVLKSGITITNLTMKGGIAEIVRYVKPGQLSSYQIGLYGMNAVELYKISLVDQGYLLKNSGRNTSIKLTFSKDGRRREDFNAENKSEGILDFKHYEIGEQNQADQSRYYNFVEKNKKLFIEQPTDTIQLNALRQRMDNGYDRLLEELATSIVDNSLLDDTFFKRLFEESNWKFPNFFGTHGFYEGKLSGFNYKKGSKEGTYNMDYYRDGKVDTSAGMMARDKTLEEILAILSR